MRYLRPGRNSGRSSGRAASVWRACQFVDSVTFVSVLPSTAADNCGTSRSSMYGRLSTDTNDTELP